MVRSYPSQSSPPGEATWVAPFRSFLGKARAFVRRMLRRRTRTRALEEPSAATRCPACQTGQTVEARIVLPPLEDPEGCTLTEVPAELCMACGEYTLVPRVARRVQDILAEDAGPAGRAEVAYRPRRVRVDLSGSVQGPRQLHSSVRVVNLGPHGALIAHAVEMAP